MEDNPQRSQPVLPRAMTQESHHELNQMSITCAMQLYHWAYGRRIPLEETSELSMGGDEGNADGRSDGLGQRYGWDGGSQKNSGSFGRQETVNLRSTFLEEGMCAEVIPKAEDITHPTDRASQLQATMSGGKTLMAGLNVGDVQIKTQDNSEGNRSLKAVGFIVSRFYRNLTICDLEEGERRTYQDQLGSVIYHSSGYIVISEAVTLRKSTERDKC
ncbi:hypothetical protein BY996DRAFT_6597645 [Phakopsora pachyrhizi]|nr:hypothetical protein BY996DRAFT_6597645 [Phakopsora pachyrhizi]